MQALDPAARALRHAAEHDADGFLAGELARRELLGYPPYGHLIRVVCSAARAGGGERGGRPPCATASTIPADVLGPAPLFRLKGRERAQLVVKSGDRERAIAAVRRAVEARRGGPARAA